MWDLHILCAVDGCEAVARSWSDLSAEDKDRIRAAYGDACLCDEHKPLMCGAVDPDEEGATDPFVCTMPKGHTGPHNGLCYTWDHRECRTRWPNEAA